jgi:glucosyl-dolichyl phosphate glucuronosyltransferase
MMEIQSVGPAGPVAPPIPTNANPSVDATILICTYNRAPYLAATLDSIGRTPVHPGFSWDVLVVDNNSSDTTREVVESRISRYPAPLHYLFEGQQGKSNALNTGMAAAHGAIIVFTDDDVQVGPEWLAAAVRPLLESTAIDYTGGPVRPTWDAPPPRWLDPSGNLGGTIAVKDHGSEPFVFEDRMKTPLGVNMAVRRTLIETIGGFRPDLGRYRKALLGQEQAEFFYRSREAGARGLYVPTMVLDHVVPAARLTPSYFRRWWYWKGVSHARVHQLHGRTELNLDVRRVPRLLGVPRYVFGSAAEHLLRWLRALVARDPVQRAEHWLSLVYYAGYCREIWRPTTLGREGGSVPSYQSPVSSSQLTARRG